MAKNSLIGLPLCFTRKGEITRGIRNITNHRFQPSVVQPIRWALQNISISPLGLVFSSKEPRNAHRRCLQDVSPGYPRCNHTHRMCAKSMCERQWSTNGILIILECAGCKRPFGQGFLAPGSLLILQLGVPFLFDGPNSCCWPLQYMNASRSQHSSLLTPRKGGDGPCAGGFQNAHFAIGQC